MFQLLKKNMSKLYFEVLKISPIEFLKEEYSLGEIKSFFEKMTKEYIKKKLTPY